MLQAAGHGKLHDGPVQLIPDGVLHAERPSRGHAAKVLTVGVIAWGVPLALFAALTGKDSVFTQQGLFFSGAALVTFGGAHAVLAYVAQKAVEVYGWLAPGEIVKGLALAETTPGPLIMVVQFVAFVGACSASPRSLSSCCSERNGRYCALLGSERHSASSPDWPAPPSPDDCAPRPTEPHEQAAQSAPGVRVQSHPVCSRATRSAKRPPSASSRAGGPSSTT